MPVFTITYRPETSVPAKKVDADTYEHEAGNGWLVLRRIVHVIGRPRDVVVRRVRSSDVLTVEARTPS